MTFYIDDYKGYIGETSESEREREREREKGREREKDIQRKRERERERERMREKEGYTKLERKREKVSKIRYIGIISKFNIKPEILMILTFNFFKNYT